MEVLALQVVVRVEVVEVEVHLPLVALVLDLLEMEETALLLA